MHGAQSEFFFDENIAIGSGQGICPHCLTKIPYFLPLEPVYDLNVAAALIPMSEPALRQHLARNKTDYKRRYRRSQDRRIHRVLTASEVRAVRKRIFRYKDAEGKPRQPTEFGE